MHSFLANSVRIGKKKIGVLLFFSSLNQGIKFVFPLTKSLWKNSKRDMEAGSAT